MTEMTLDQIKLAAAREANREGKTLCVINLNRIGRPLYVIRECVNFTNPAIVWFAHPSTVDQGG